MSATPPVGASDAHDYLPPSSAGAPHAISVPPTTVAASATADAIGHTRTLRVAFTGSGSEYFRIWIVNLLLSMVTLGFYLPFARARRLAYFHGNTQLDGHALGFHGDPWKMLRGYVLMLGLGGAYALASRWSPLATLAAVSVMALAWPALWRASLQFRLANTSWRGLRFGFDGDLRGAYAAMLPAFLPAVAMIAVMALAGPETNEAGELTDPDSGKTFGLLFGGVVLASLLISPWAIAAIKRYQHGHYRYSSQHTLLRARTGAFYTLTAKVLGVALLIGLVSAVLGLAAWYATATWWGGDGEGLDQFAIMAGATVGIGLFYLSMLIVLLPYWTSRLQNLVWGSTGAAQLQFASDLKLGPTIALHVKNALLTALTLGLYWPFAAVATARLRLQAVSVALQGDVDQWVAHGTRRFDDASGDAAGDFFGIDLGL